jgi:hypothetical protein
VKALSLSRIAPCRTPRTDPHAILRGVQLGRIAWMITTLACLMAAVVVLISGRSGYAVVAFAVAVSAGINLL